MILPRTSPPKKQRIDFEAIKAASLRSLPDLVNRWVPGGKMFGREYTVRNPKRGDRNEGNFKINLDSGRWADFATEAKGGDAISLAAYLFDITQVEAARRLAVMLGIEVGDDRAE